MTGQDILDSFLTEEERQRWRYNMYNYGDYDIHNTLMKRFRDGTEYMLISNYFSWISTEDGVVYWEDICLRISNGEKIEKIEEFIITKHRFT